MQPRKGKINKLKRLWKSTVNTNNNAIECNVYICIYYCIHSIYYIHTETKLVRLKEISLLQSIVCAFKCDYRINNYYTKWEPKLLGSYNYAFHILLRFYELHVNKLNKFNYICSCNIVNVKIIIGTTSLHKWRTWYIMKRTGTETYLLYHIK